MTAIVANLNVNAAFSPQQVTESIVSSTALQSALNDGSLLEMTVRFDAQDTSKGVLYTRWASPTALKNFQKANPDALSNFEISGQQVVEVARESPVLVSAERLP